MSVRILFVDDDDDIRQLYTIVFDNLSFDCEVVEAISGNDAIETISKSKPFDVVVSDYNMGNGNGGIIYKYIRQNCPETSFILLTSEQITDLPEFNNIIGYESNCFYLQKPVSAEEVKKRVINIVSSFRNMEIIKDDFRKIRVLFFLRFGKTLCDVYLKLSDSKMVKIFSKGAVFSTSDIKRYVERGVDFLYIIKNDYERFKVTFLQTPFLVSSDENEKGVDVWNRTHEVIHELVTVYGISRSVVNLTSEIVEKNLKELDSTSGVMKLMNIQREKQDYIYDHSYLVSIISCAILKQLSWQMDGMLNKMCQAALFHDITLADSEIASIPDVNHHRFEIATWENQKKYLEHPIKAVELLMDEPTISSDVITVVAQHHENVDGSGFPLGITGEKIAPLSCLFIVAHDFIDEMYRSNFDPLERRELMRNLEMKYNIGNFKGIVSALRDAVYGKEKNRSLY